MAQPFIGQIMAVGFNFAPIGWLPCDGRLVAIAENPVLYNLLGTIYGGDGQSTFALPDLRGRSLLSMGQGPGLSSYVIGQPGGTENVTLVANQMPSHSHRWMTSSKAADQSTPANTLVVGQNSEPLFDVYAPPPANTSLQGGTIGASTGGQPHENRQPYLVINYIICTEGVYPSQN